MPSPQGKVAAEPPDEVLSRRCTAFTCSGCLVIATILQLRTGRTTSSVSSLTLGSTFHNPGKAYEVFLAAILIMAQCLRTVRRTVLTERRAIARVAFPGLGPLAPGKKSSGLFSAKGGRQPRTVAAEPPDEVVAPGRPPSSAVDTPSSLLSCSCIPGKRPHPSAH